MKSLLGSAVRAVEQWPMPLRLAVAIGSTLLFGYLDYRTGPEISFALFYLVPVLFATWFVGTRWGLILTLASVVEWHIANRAAEEVFSHPLIPYWNTLTRLIIFVLVTLLMAQIRRDLAFQKALADTDFLTGALSRRAFYQRVEAELLHKARHGFPLTVLYLDADNFKAVNDERGHDEGDRLLRCCADTIRSVLRSSDSVARLGGDEFAVLLPEASSHEAQNVVAKLRARLEAEMRRHGWPVTFSIGVLCCERTPDSMQEMVQMADALMYDAKRGGKNAVSLRIF